MLSCRSSFCVDSFSSSSLVLSAVGLLEAVDGMLLCLDSWIRSPLSPFGFSLSFCVSSLAELGNTFCFRAAPFSIVWFSDSLQRFFLLDRCWLTRTLGFWLGDHIVDPCPAYSFFVSLRDFARISVFQFQCFVFTPAAFQSHVDQCL